MCISPKALDLEHFSMCPLSISISSFEKCVRMSFACFLTGLFVWCWPTWTSYVSWVMICRICKHFLHFVRCLLCCPETSYLEVTPILWFTLEIVWICSSIGDCSQQPRTQARSPTGRGKSHYWSHHPYMCEDALTRNQSQSRESNLWWDVDLAKPLLTETCIFKILTHGGVHVKGFGRFP